MQKNAEADIAGHIGHTISGGGPSGGGPFPGQSRRAYARQEAAGASPAVSGLERRQRRGPAVLGWP
ncbi:MAG: hypothetical protein JWL68_3207 [Actinomycetia bacterium]|nr:hypothetical protein [Actinomycetes bacterium]